MASLQFVTMTFLVLLGLSVLYTTKGLPVPDSSENDGRSVSSDSESGESDELESVPVIIPQRNKTKDLYVVKAVVYEIGILTDSSDEDNSTDFESQERVDLTFFDTHKNNTHINLGRIPLPIIQTNISGQVLTGIAPVDIGAFSSAAELLQTLPITGTIVNITHSDTGYFQLTTSNLTDYEKPHFLNVDDLKSIPDISQSFSDLTSQLAQEPDPSQVEKVKIASDNLIKK